MKVYFYEEGLIESQEFYIDNEAQYFLFSSISSVYPLVKFEEELAEINDYCVFILSKIEDKLNTLIKDSDVHFELIKDCQDTREHTEEDIEDIFDPAYMFTPV